MTHARKYKKKSVPDGGWGWVVVAASFMIQVITNGTTLTFGIVFVELLKYFHGNQSNTAWIGSIQAFFMYISGFLCTPFLHRFGYRAMTIVGASFSAVGFGTSALATDIYLLYFTYGLLTGIGNGLMYLTSIVIVQQYFSKRRGIANGITMTGSGVGIVAFGISTPFLVSAMSWQSMLVFNAVVCGVVGVVSGALYRPLPDQILCIASPQQSKKEEDMGQPPIGATTEPITESCGLDITISYHEQNVFTYSSVTDGDYEIVEKISVRKSAPIFSIVPEIINDSGLFDFEFMEFPLAVESELPRKTRRHYLAMSHAYQFLAICREMFDFSLLKNPVFDLFTFAVLLFTYGMFVQYSFVPEWALVLGAPIDVTSFLIPIVGFSSIFSRLGFGFLIDKVPQQRFDINGCLLAANCVLCLLSACFLNYQSLILYSACFGFIAGGVFTVYPVVLVDLVGREMFDKALGLVLAITSLARLTTGPISGLIIDQLGNTEDVLIPFVTVGGCQIAGIAAYFSIIYVQKCQLKRRENELFKLESEPLLKK